MKIAFIILIVFIILVLVWYFFSGPGVENNVLNDADDGRDIDDGKAETEAIIGPPVGAAVEGGTEGGNPVATLQTNKGEIAIELFLDTMPITAGNFLKLAKEGFYDGTKFHRIISDFMLQGGDPNSKGDDTSIYGRGGPGYTIEDEFVDGLSNVRGTLSMANTGQLNSGGSQFFINLVDNTNLDFDKPPQTSRHPVFGKVISGMDIVDAIAQVATGANDVPLEPVIIESVVMAEQ